MDGGREGGREGIKKCKLCEERYTEKKAGREGRGKEWGENARLRREESMERGKK